MKKVKSLDEIIPLSEKGVTLVRHNGTRMPAAFLIGIPIRSVHYYVKQGLYIYKKKK